MRVFDRPLPAGFFLTIPPQDIIMIASYKTGDTMDDYFNIRLADDDIRAISSIGLAHLGDAVYELLVRAYLCAHGRATGKGLHRAAVELVRAPS